MPPDPPSLHAYTHIIIYKPDNQVTPLLQILATALDYYPVQNSR